MTEPAYEQTFAFCSRCGVNPSMSGEPGAGDLCRFCEQDDQFESCEFCHGEDCTFECEDERL